FTLDTGMQRSEEGDELFYPRLMVVVAAIAGGVMPIDTPFNDFRDEEGLLKETRLARRLGFQGKYVIHPSQIEPVNRAFRPSPQELEQARKVVDAFESAQAQGFASTSVDGKMVDVPQATRARRLLQIAETIQRREAAPS
ncbi:MAG: HpcH/HpaI aldolase/citrate lyase family protein, partial [Chloroflexota bacterium]